MASSPTIREILLRATERLKAVNTERPLLEARLLLGEVTGLRGEELIIHDQRVPSSTEVQTFEQLVSRRLNSEPIALILGRKEFFGLSFEVSSEVLIPRPETEGLVEGVLSWIDENSLEGQKHRILDMGTGSGCILIALAKQLGASFEYLGLDQSESALELAQKNARALLKFPVGLERFDLEKDPAPGGSSILVSNPPYIPSAELANLALDIKNFEPMEALDGGDDGMHFYRLMAKKFLSSPKRPQLVAFECHHAAQAKAVETQILKDVVGTKSFWHDGPHLFMELK